MMNDNFARLISEDTLEIVRMLPASRETVWEFIVNPELRKKWFCSGAMGQKPGEAFFMEFDNSQHSKTIPPEAASDACHLKVTMEGTLTCFEPLQKLGYFWPGETDDESSHVVIQLEDLGDQTRLRLTHSRLTKSEHRTEAAAGWHAHLDLCIAAIAGQERQDFWQRHSELRSRYRTRFHENTEGVS